MKPSKYHSITDIVATVYCEQKAVYDQTRGDARPLAVRMKAAAGTFEHFRFQVEGQSKQVIDQRCFIASQVYGPDALETTWLRGWRDRTLMPHRLGRFFIAIYYRLSPGFVLVLARSPILAALVRSLLDRILRILGRSA